MIQQKTESKRDGRHGRQARRPAWRGDTGACPCAGGGLSVLKYLCISNLAVIENIEIRFSEGLTVLTGETGAGKSILIDALGLILGDRADTSIIRTGHDRAEVSAEFELPADEPLLRLLDEQSINVENNEGPDTTGH